VQRSRWLAELAAALEQATELTLDLFDYGSEGKEAVLLRGRILTLRDEVDLIQKRRRPAAEEAHPHWMQ